MWFLSLIPNALGVIGDATKGFFGWLNKKQDVDLEKYRVKGNIDIKAIEADTALTQARVDLVKVRGNDPDAKMGRVLIIGGTSMWVGSHMWYASFFNLLPSYLVWKPVELPTSIEYIPYAVIAYLFAVIIKNGLAK